MFYNELDSEAGGFGCAPSSEFPEPYLVLNEPACVVHHGSLVTKDRWCCTLITKDNVLPGHTLEDSALRARNR